MDLVIDVGALRVKGGFYENGQLVETFAVAADPFSADEMKKKLKKAENVLACSTNPKAAAGMEAVLKEAGLKTAWLNIKDFEKMLDNAEEFGGDRIANVYGALRHFPTTDCIVVNIGEAAIFDCIAKTGKYMGGATLPLNINGVKKPESAIGKTNDEHLQSGIYFGMLGAIERIVAELRMASVSPSSVSVVATGAVTESEGFDDDLMDFVDLVDPHLTLAGLFEILKERRI